MALLVLAMLWAPGAGDPEADPRAAEVDRLLEAAEESEPDEPPGPREWTESPWASALLAGGAAALGGGVAAVVLVWAYGRVVDLQLGSTGLYLLAAVPLLPLVPAAAAGGAVLVVQPWWVAGLVGGATVLAGGTAVGAGLAATLLLAPEIEDPIFLLTVAAVTGPVLAAVVAATTSGALVPLAAELWTRRTSAPARAGGGAE